MKRLRQFLIKTLGLQSYLSLVSKVYIYCTGKGMMKKKYPELFMLRNIVKPGFHCIDIGANLGYYSVKLSNIVGSSGKVYAVEPVPMFYEIWKRNTARFALRNIELFPYALGSEECVVKMGMPMVDGLAHHGMTKVTSGTNEKFAASFEAQMKVPDQLFAKIDKLDFIKCDIEGYENVAFGNMKQTLAKFTPLIQSELGGDSNRKKVITQLEDMGYTTCILKNGKLTPADEMVKFTYQSDFYFLHQKHSFLLK